MSISEIGSVRIQRNDASYRFFNRLFEFVTAQDKMRHLRREACMSYDLYCYRSQSAEPDVEEARRIVDSFNADEEAGQIRSGDRELKERIAAALIQQNPRLERFDFDYRAIAESDKISEEQARARYQHIELNPPEGDLAIQLFIHNDHAFITMPYWYKGEDADRLFSTVMDYLRVLNKVAGLFAYDPQTDKAFDPQNVVVLGHSEYDKVVDQMPKIVCRAISENEKRPWWRFW